MVKLFVGVLRGSCGVCVTQEEGPESPKVVRYAPTKHEEGSGSGCERYV